MAAAFSSAGARVTTPVAQAHVCPPERQPQREQDRAAQCVELNARGVGPDALIWVELRRIATQLLQMRTPDRALTQEILHWLAAIEQRDAPADPRFASDDAPRDALAQESTLASGQRAPEATGSASHPA